MAAISWCNRLTTVSHQGQHLIWILAELLRLYDVGINAEDIPGVRNEIADFISRPDPLISLNSLSHYERAQQIFHQYNFLRTWRYFRPSPELLQLISSYLFTVESLGRPTLPSKLGQFEAAVSTTSGWPTL